MIGRKICNKVFAEKVNPILSFLDIEVKYNGIDFIGGHNFD